jgi:short-subunit dehydrogenase
MTFKDKKILITGGTSGIGKALVEECIERGATHIAVLARSAQGLSNLALEFPSANFLLLCGSISDINTIHESIQKIESEWGVIDIIINNAGVVSAGKLESISDQDIIDQIMINLTGPLLLTKACLPLLRKSKDAAIINISSGLGLIAMPFYSVYASAKAGIKQFSDALRRELAPAGIHVLCIYPTATDTKMMKTAKTTQMDDAKMVAKKSIEALMAREINLIFGGNQRIEDCKLNFESPRKMDQKIAMSYDALMERTSAHRSM